MARQDFANIILFDGHCNLCNGVVQFVLKHDKNKRFRFGSLQGESGQQLLRQYNMPTQEFNTVIVILNNRIYTHSTAALMLVRNLSGLWPMLYVFILVPVFIRDRIYNWVAQNRYRWFGKKETCWVPRPEYRNRFID